MPVVASKYITFESQSFQPGDTIPIEILGAASPRKFQTLIATNRIRIVPDGLEGKKAVDDLKRTRYIDGAGPADPTAAGDTGGIGGASGEGEPEGQESTGTAPEGETAAAKKKREAAEAKAEKARKAAEAKALPKAAPKSTRKR